MSLPETEKAGNYQASLLPSMGQLAPLEVGEPAMKYTQVSAIPESSEGPKASIRLHPRLESLGRCKKKPEASESPDR